MSILFEEWKALIFSTSDHFVEDGVISNEHWVLAGKRVLFILKETNDYQGNIANLIRAAATSRPQSKLWDRPTFHNLGRWAYGLLNTEASYKEADAAKKQALLPCAFINIKKTSGGRVATTAVEANARMYATFLRRQIAIISPDIIIFGGTYKMIKDHVLPELKKVGPRVHKHGEKVICINANHPACTKRRTEMYDQVVGSYQRFVAGIKT